MCPRPIRTINAQPSHRFLLVQVCVDHVDTLYFQDDRLWFADGGQWNAAGEHGACPARYHGKAYINEVEWDISSLGACAQGVACPVSKTFTDYQFTVPQGCSSVSMTATLNAGRGQINSFPPSRANYFRGEIEVSDDGFGGPDVYDITVSLTCENQAPAQDVTAGSTAVQNARLSCVHQSQRTADPTATQSGPNSGASCRMGRVEVYNRMAQHADGVGQGTWGTVCGHWFWDNDNFAGVVCRQLGFEDGVGYTFGSTRLLPTLPIVAGFRSARDCHECLLRFPVCSHCRSLCSHCFYLCVLPFPVCSHRFSLL